MKASSHIINFFALRANKGSNIGNNFRPSWASKIGILKAHCEINCFMQLLSRHPKTGLVWFSDGQNNPKEWSRLLIMSWKLNNLFSFGKTRDHRNTINGQNITWCLDLKWFSCLNHLYFKIGLVLIDFVATIKNPHDFWLKYEMNVKSF